MRKIFLSTLFILTLLSATVFAAEEPAKEETGAGGAGYDYTSQTYGFRIVCPTKPTVVVNPFEDPKERGELLVFANDGMKVLYGYQIKFDAFDDKLTPNFNKDKKQLLEAYLEELKIKQAFEDASIAEVTRGNKGVFAVTAREIEITNDKGEVEDVAVAETQNQFVFFRTKSGQRISIQLIVNELNEEVVTNFRKSVATFQDAAELAKKNKKSKK